MRNVRFQDAFDIFWHKTDAMRTKGTTQSAVNTFANIWKPGEMAVQLALHLIILCQQVLIADHAACQNTH